MHEGLGARQIDAALRANLEAALREIAAQDKSGSAALRLVRSEAAAEWGECVDSVIFDAIVWHSFQTRKETAWRRRMVERTHT